MNGSLSFLTALTNLEVLGLEANKFGFLPSLVGLTKLSTVA